VGGGVTLFSMNYGTGWGAQVCHGGIALKCGPMIQCKGGKPIKKGGRRDVGKGGWVAGEGWKGVWWCRIDLTEGQAHVWHGQKGSMRGTKVVLGEGKTCTFIALGVVGMWLRAGSMPTAGVNGGGRYEKIAAVLLAH